MPQTEWKLDTDGEILLKNPGVFKGYFLDEKASTASLEPGGWLRTGDIVEVLDNGEIAVIDRKKAIIITAGGKNIAPKNIEAAIKQSPLVGEAVVIGDRRKFLTALVTLEPTATQNVSLEQLRTQIQAKIDEAAAQTAVQAAAVQAPAVQAQLPTGALVIDKPLRSGQQVYARGTDLIVLALVSYGAEVIADGSIHVYAPLRGRALAGVKGATSARIYTTCMQAQLLSIAGTYRTGEAAVPAPLDGRPAMARLDGDALLVEPLPG